jgi:hypothetical protein
MPNLLNSRKSIRLSILAGAIAAAIFTEAKAFANQGPLMNYTEFYNRISTDTTGEFDLGANIEVPLGDGPVFMTLFTGVLNGFKEGGNYVISGLTRPLFNSIGDDGVVKNLNLVTAETGVNGDGALANALLDFAEINNVTVTGKVTGDGDYTGGLVSFVNGGTISNSAVIGNSTISGVDNVGGLIGYVLNGTILNSSVTGTVSISGGNDVGGLIGLSGNGYVFEASVGDGVTVTGTGEYIGGLAGSSYGYMDSSHAHAVVIGTGMGEEDHGIGGLVGYLGGSLYNSSATGTVTGSYEVGGLVGATGGGASIQDSHATGVVNGIDKVGGLVGNLDQFHPVYDSYATGEVNGRDYVGGLVGISYGEITDSDARTDFDATDHVSGRNFVGGLVGFKAGGDIIRSSATVGVSGVDNVGGLVGGVARIFNEEADFWDAETTYSENDLVFYNGDLYSLSRATSTGEQPDTNNSWILYDQQDLGNGYFVGESLYVFNGSVWINVDATPTISSSFAKGNVTGDDNLGGLVGVLRSNGTIFDSYATGNVTGDDNDADDLGGLVGEVGSDATISISHATGNVIGDDNLGGLVGLLGSRGTISYSYANGNITGDDDLGGLVGEVRSDATISYSYAKGIVTGDDEIGGLVGLLGSRGTIVYSYATGKVNTYTPLGVVTGETNEVGGDVGGLVGRSLGDIINSHASGNVSGFYDVGGLVGDLDERGVISNSYATGNVRAIGSLDTWENGWGGLVGESSGFVFNSYATGNVVADYNYGSLIGFLMRYEDEEQQQLSNSYATGSTSSANNPVEIYEDGELITLKGFGGFVGCAIDGNEETYVCPEEWSVFPQTTPSILSVVNTDVEPAFEIVVCENNGLPMISTLIETYETTCISRPAAALLAYVQSNPKFTLADSTILRLFLYLAGDYTIRITVEDFIVLGATGVNEKNLPVLLKLLKKVDLSTLDLNTINKNVKMADELLKKKKK